jgi:hypothetical protein
MPKFTEADVRDEPMFFSAGTRIAWNEGGAITRAFLQAVPKDWLEDGIFDSRVHMLMEGWYPCIPGFHVDDAPRCDRKDGQPNHINPSYQAEHIFVIVGDCSQTRMLDGELVLPEPEDGSGVTTYRLWDEQLNASSQGIASWAVSGQLYWFDWQGVHRGSPATKAGWRWFGRISRGTPRKKTNEMRKQVQVYISPINKGW